MSSRKCSSCGAFGLGVVQANGLCGHCTSKLQTASAAMPQVGHKRRREEDEEGPRSKDDIARLLAEAEKTEVPTLDVTGVKKILLSLEKKITANTLVRAKWATEPARFMASEVELDEELKRARVLAAAPEHYPLLLGDSSSSSASNNPAPSGMGTFRSLLGLLTHENSDIAIDCLQLFEELTDAENVLVEDNINDDNGEGNSGDEDEESSDDEEKRHDAAAQRRRQLRKEKKQQKQAKKRGLFLLLKAFIDEGALELLLGTLLRLESAGGASGGEGEEENQGIYSCLGLFSNLVESDATLEASSSAASGSNATAATIRRLNIAARLVRITKATMTGAAGSGAGTKSDSLSDAAVSSLPSGYGSSSSTSSTLLGFLLRKVRTRPPPPAPASTTAAGAAADLYLFDSNKGMAAELMSVLLSADVEANAAALGKGLFVQQYQQQKSSSSNNNTAAVEGMEALLEALNIYRKRSPSSKEEEECVENLFDCCCTALMLPYNQQRFREIEGFELMITMVSLAGFSRYGALKVLSYALQDSPLNCAALVDAGGLKELFPAFMGKGLALTKKLHGGDAAKEELEHAIAIVSSCAALLPLPGGKLEQHVGVGVGADSTTRATAGLQLLRFLSKFTESRCEKLDRLVELRRQAAAKVHRASLRRLEEEKEEGLESDSDDDDDDNAAADEYRKAVQRRRQLREELRYSARMDAGLCTLQRLDVVFARLASVAVEAAASSKGSVPPSPAPAPSSYLPLLQEVAFNCRKKLYEAAGASASSSSSSSGAASAGGGEEEEDPETAAILRSGLPPSLSLSLTGIGEVLLEFATRLEREEEEKEEEEGRSSRRSNRASMQLAQLRPLLARLTVAAGWGDDASGRGGSAGASDPSVSASAAAASS